MNRVNLLHTSMMTPAERLAGRFMRAPDHPLAGDDTGGTQTSAPNNAGNAGESGTSETDEDNTSQTNDLDGFWDKKPEEGAASESDDETRTASQALGQELGQIIKGFKGPDVFTKEIADKIADGDLEGVNSALANRDQALLQQAVVVTAKMFGGVIDKLSADFDARIQKALGNKDNEIALETHFPLAKDPAMRPMVQRVWDQALVNSKGNREKAIQLTRGMLDAFGSKTSIREPADDPTAGIGTSASKQLVASLLERDT